jgi:hypothetical protein
LRAINQPAFNKQPATTNQHSATRTRKMKKTYLIVLQIILTTIVSQSQNFYKDWRLYKNNEYNFEVQFPNECIEINSGGKIPEERKQLLREKGNLPSWQDKMIFSISFANQVVPLFSVSIYNFSDQSDFETYCYNLINTYKGNYQKEEVKFEQFEFDKYLGLKAIYQNKAGGYDGMNKRIFIKKDNLVFDIFIYNPPHDYDGFLQEVMNTFKFSR